MLSTFWPITLKEVFGAVARNEIYYYVLLLAAVEAAAVVHNLAWNGSIFWDDTISELMLHLFLSDGGSRYFVSVLHGYEYAVQSPITPLGDLGGDYGICEYYSGTVVVVSIIHFR